MVSATRIELLDSLLSSRLMSSFAWKDSSIAYAWIYNIKKLYNSFIQPRVQLIRELLFISFWRLSSHLNLADIVLRDFLLYDLIKNEIWFEGLTFLTSPEGG